VAPDFRDLIVVGPASVWAMRDLLAVKHSPACISVVDKGSGQLLWRPAWSCSVSFGFHPCGHHPLGPCGPREWKWKSMAIQTRK
jgi:hypothetical protein